MGELPRALSRILQICMASQEVRPPLDDNGLKAMLFS
jgi:hypothetical protein